MNLKYMYLPIICEKKFEKVVYCRSPYIFILIYCHPQAKEKQEELAMDMKILEKLLDDTRNEVKEETQRKVCTIYSCLSGFNICTATSHMHMYKMYWTTEGNTR